MDDQLLALYKQILDYITVLETNPKLSQKEREELLDLLKTVVKVFRWLGIFKPEKL
jgi:hypothetical protein